MAPTRTISRLTGAPRPRGGLAHVAQTDQLAFLSSVQVATPRQFGLAFDHDVWWAYKRLDRLARHGLIARARPQAGLPGVVWLTPAGLTAAGCVPGRQMQQSVDRLRHDLAVTELLVDLRTRAIPVIATERELRRDDAERPHCPDLVVATEAGECALEVEFSVKSRARLRRILDGYRGTRYAEVIYYLRSDGLARTLAQIASECGLGDRLELRPWMLWPDPTPRAAEIEAVAAAHRQADATPADPPRVSEPVRERDRAEAIEAWERELARRDGKTAPRLRRVLGGA